MSTSHRGIPHCSVRAHAGFPLPCYQCATPIKPAEASSVRHRSPATTSAEARRMRLLHEEEAALVKAATAGVSKRSDAFRRK